MRSLLLFILCISSTIIFAQDMNVMTFNIRYDNPNDAEQGNGWKEHRRERVVRLIQHYNPDLLGIQEAMKHQLEYLLEKMPEYDYIGVGRDDGKEKGEFSAVLYKKDRFNIAEHNTFWLSETPDKPSKSWDAALPRVVTWGKFEDKKNENKGFYLFNTHFDHKGHQARVNSAKLINKKISKISDGQATILTGDFNAIPDEETYGVLQNELQDARKVSEKPPYGPEGTFSGFDVTSDKDFRRIDYVFVEDFDVTSFETITDYSGDKYPSDHLPIMIKVKYEK